MSYYCKYWVSYSIRDRCDREEPDREESELIRSLHANRGQDPNAQPDQIENYEEIGRPWREAKQRGKPILKSRDRLLHEAQTLDSQPNHKEAYRLLPGSQIVV
ncbi:MAG TPA: hypothetical protein VGQ49_25880 [Bryobacteraceae bacterium]|jgi:hypothetical protein|nr:hypothetical protein [Bryobacteraceae bacterium]